MSEFYSNYLVSNKALVTSFNLTQTVQTLQTKAKMEGRSFKFKNYSSQTMKKISAKEKKIKGKIIQTIIQFKKQTSRDWIKQLPTNYSKFMNQTII